MLQNKLRLSQLRQIDLAHAQRHVEVVSPREVTPAAPPPLQHQELSKTMDDEGLSLAISHNGKYIATGGSATVVKLWGFDAADLIFEGKGHSGAIAGVR